MSVIDDYHQNLSDWVDGKLAQGVSVRTLARLISEKAQSARINVEIGYGAIWGWKTGRLKGELEPLKLQAIALYEETSPEEMLAKLRTRREGGVKLSREQVLQWVKRASFRDIGFVGMAIAERFTQENTSVPVMVDDPPVQAKTSGDSTDMIELRPYADLRLSVILRHSLGKLGLSYSAAASRGLAQIGQTPETSSTYLEDLRVLTTVIRRVMETQYRSTPLYSDKNFKAIAALCFRVERWEGADKPILGNTQYGTNYQSLITDLEQVSNGNELLL